MYGKKYDKLQIYDGSMHVDDLDVSHIDSF